MKVQDLFEWKRYKTLLAQQAEDRQKLVDEIRAEKIEKFKDFLVKQLGRVPEKGDLIDFKRGPRGGLSSKADGAPYTVVGIIPGAWDDRVQQNPVLKIKPKQSEGWLVFNLTQKDLNGAFIASRKQTSKRADWEVKVVVWNDQHATRERLYRFPTFSAALKKANTIASKFKLGRDKLSRKHLSASLYLGSGNDYEFVGTIDIRRYLPKKGEKRAQ